LGSKRKSSGIPGTIPFDSRSVRRICWKASLRAYWFILLSSSPKDLGGFTWAGGGTGEICNASAMSPDEVASVTLAGIGVGSKGTSGGGVLMGGGLDVGDGVTVGVAGFT